MHPNLDRDTFLVNQKFAAFGKSKYYVYDEGGTPLFYVERPTMRFFGKRGNITIFENETKLRPVLVLQQDHRYEFRRREYTVVDAADDGVVGHLRRDNIRALFRRTWTMHDAEGVLAGGARENSTLMTIVRRVLDFIPYVSLLAPFVKTDFDVFLTSSSGEETPAGRFDRKVGIGDKYVLQLDGDRQRRFDRRLALALGILLDTAEAR